MSFVARIRRALAAMVVVLALVAFLVFGALAQTGGDDSICENVDDYNRCVQAWVENCAEVDDLDLCKGSDG